MIGTIFDNLCREINTILDESGQSFGVVAEYQIQRDKLGELFELYDNIGVVYVNLGELYLLEGNQGLEGSMTLDLLMKVREDVNLESNIREPIDLLTSRQNGILIETALDGTQTVYQYVLNYHVPTTTGHQEIASNGTAFIRYSVPIDLVVATGVTYGDDMQLAIKVGANYVKVKNVTEFILAPNVALDTKEQTNTNTNKAMPIAKSWGASVIVTFDKNDTLHKAIFNALESDPFTEWDIEYGFSDDFTEQEPTTTKRHVISHDSTISFIKGVPSKMTLNLAEAVE